MGSDPRVSRESPEPGALRIERLVELAEHPGIAADLYVGQQFRAQVVQFADHETGGGVVAAVALKIVLQIQAEPYVVGTPGLTARTDLEAGFRGRTHGRACIRSG